jgi:amino acid adenylation domain-containing protein
LNKKFSTTYPISTRQKALWIEEEIYLHLPVNNVLTRLTIKGPLQIGAFTRAFNRLCQQHLIFSFVVKLDDINGKRIFEKSAKEQHELQFIELENNSVSGYEQTKDFQSWCKYKFAYGECLYKAQLVKLSKELFCFYLNQHHSITDSFSCRKIYKLLSDYYQLELGLQKDSSIELEYNNFSSFLMEKRGYKQSTSFNEKEEFWMSRYAQAVEPVQFYNHSSYNKTVQTTRISYQLDEDTTASLNQLSSSIPEPIIFTSALFAFLSRITLNEDLSVGVHESNRTGKYTDTIGLLMEVCPYRLSIDKEDTFENIVKKVLVEADAVYEYKSHFVSAKKAGYEVTLNFIISPSNCFSDLDIDYELSTPLNFLNESDVDTAEIGGLGGESLAVQIQRSSDNEKFNLNFDFNLGVWTSSILRERAVKHFDIILKAFLNNLTHKLVAVDLLTPDEKLLLFPTENSAYVRGDKIPIVIDLFQGQVTKSPNKIAVQLDKQDVSYAKLSVQVDKLAQQLCHLGVKPGVLVGVCIERSPRMIGCVLAIMQAGGAYVPIDPKQPSDRIAIILEDAEPLVLITETKLRDKISFDDKKKVICLDDNSAKIISNIFKYPEIIGSDLAYVIFTSGSTGRPKGVKVTHHGLSTLLLAVIDKPGISSVDTLLAVSTISFDIAAVDMFLPLICGATVRIAPYESTINGDKLKLLIEKKEITFFQATPASYRLLISSGWKGSNNLKLISTGEALPFDLAQDLLSRCESLWNMYGPTETTIWSSSHNVRKDEKFISIGKPIVGTQMYVLNESLKPVPIGVSGELYIAGDGVTDGYYRNEDLTKEQFRLNPFSKANSSKMYKTGDLVRYTSDMTLEYLGRADFQVKVRGFRIETGEVESVLGNYNSVAQSVVTTWSDELGEHTLIAYLVAAGNMTIDGGLLRNYLKTKLPDYMIPSKFVLLESLPLTPNGKVNRKALPDPDISMLISVGSEYKEPRTDFERSLVAVWQGVLKSSKVGIADNFFDLGGDSLMTIPLVYEMEKATGIKFDIGDIFSSPTIEELVETQGGDIDKRASSCVSLQSKGTGTPLFCLCGINLYQELADTLGKARPVYGIYVADEQLFLESLMTGGKTDISVEKLTRLYYDAICRQQPEGPYQLVGISFGGLLAFETARLLKANNKEVLSVTLLDTILPTGIKRSLLNKGARFVKSIFNKVYLAVNKQFGFSAIQNRSKIIDIRNEAFFKSMKVYESSDGLYNGHVILIKASDHGFWGKGVSLLPDYGWSRYIKGKSDCYEIEGDHLGIIEQPNVSQVVHHMNSYLK